MFTRILPLSFRPESGKGGMHVVEGQIDNEKHNPYQTVFKKMQARLLKRKYAQSLKLSGAICKGTNIYIHYRCLLKHNPSHFIWKSAEFLYHFVNIANQIVSCHFPEQLL